MGSGTSVIAAETAGRVCLGLELSPAYVDVIVERWQRYTGKQAILEGDLRSFAAIKADRLVANDGTPAHCAGSGT